MRNNKRRNRKGFTLIEIIAVLILLAILAALAIPRYFTMQTEAATQTIKGAVAEMNACLVQQWAKKQMDPTYVLAYDTCEDNLAGFTLGAAFGADTLVATGTTIVNDSYSSVSGSLTQETTSPPAYSVTVP